MQPVNHDQASTCQDHYFLRRAIGNEAVDNMLKEDAAKDRQKQESEPWYRDPNVMKELGY